MKVYVAGAYRERDRVLRAMRQIRESGHPNNLELAYDWVENIDARKAEGFEEADLDPATRDRYALEDLKYATEAGVFWMLAPEDGGRGCWFEAGYVVGHPRAWHSTHTDPLVTIVSGPHLVKSIFTERFHFKFSQDAEAYDFIFQRGWK